jgi:hypothetical protein
LALANRRIALRIMRRVYGSAFTIDLPIFGQLVVISDPNDIRQARHRHHVPSGEGPTLQIGPWTLPQGQTIVTSIGVLHADESVFHAAHRFDADRFLSRRLDPAEWIPYGGGVRRCIGAPYATMEIRAVLRTLLRDFTISLSNAHDEGLLSRGVALAPSRGALVRVRRRHAIASSR